MRSRKLAVVRCSWIRRSKCDGGLVEGDYRSKICLSHIKLVLANERLDSMHDPNSNGSVALQIDVMTFRDKDPLFPSDLGQNFFCFILPILIPILIDMP